MCNEFIAFLYSFWGETFNIGGGKSFNFYPILLIRFDNLGFLTTIHYLAYIFFEPNKGFKMVFFNPLTCYGVTNYKVYAWFMVTTLDTTNVFHGIMATQEGFDDLWVHHLFGYTH